IRSIDTRAALAMPGVRAAVTARDVGKPTPTIPFRRANPTAAPYAQPVIAEHLVRYVGEPVAMVLADSAERAEDAVQAVALDLEPLPAVTDRRASEAGELLLMEGTSKNFAAPVTGSKGAFPPPLPFPAPTPPHPFPDTPM